MKIVSKNLKKGGVFDNPPPRILFGKSESERRSYFKNQFNLLIKHWNEIPWRQWGVGSSKNLSDLLREIGLGETQLAVKKGQLIRKLDIIIVFVFYKNLWLTEEPQEMSDGRIRNRRFPYISEKLRIGETPEDTAIRALREESGGYIKAGKNKLIKGGYTLLDENNPYNTGSSSYPGLKSVKKAYTFAYFIDKSEYKKKYIEVDVAGTLTFHSWKKITENYWFTGTPLEKVVSKKIKTV